MPEIISQDFYFTIWSFRNDVYFQDHFDKVGFSKIFAVDPLEVKEFAKVENPEKRKGTLYKFKSLNQLKMEIMTNVMSVMMPKDMEAPGDIQAALMIPV